MKLEVYEPQEDSFLLRDQVLKYTKGKVLDIGTGSGIQAIAASSRAESVLAVDIDPYAVKFAASEAKGLSAKNIKFRKSDLFSNIKGKFNLIIFNPPYLPALKGEPKRLARQLSGGKKGYELLERFFRQVNSYLEKDGKILITFSTLTKKEKVDEIIDKYGFQFVIISKTSIHFEELFVYEIERTDLLKTFTDKGIKDIQKFAHGHRGVIFKGKLKNKTIAIKSKLQKSKAIGNIEREAEWLKILNKKSIGPKLIEADKDYFIYEFAEGQFIRDFLKIADKQKIKTVLIKVLKQCYTLDKLKINKEEMHHPVKHVIIGKNITLLDFERASKSIKPHNVTQFCQYIINQRKQLNKKGFKISKENMIKLAKSYKEKPIITPIIKALD